MVHKNHKVFHVAEARIGDFLEILDPGQSARVTYRGWPKNDYVVVLDEGTTWDTDPGFDITGITPVLEPVEPGLVRHVCKNTMGG